VHASLVFAIALLGAALVVAAASANQPWLDRHFLPSFFLPRHVYVLIETVVRVCIAAAGASLVLGRSRVAVSLTHAPGTAVRTVIAAILAVVASEGVLRVTHARPTGWLAVEEEPRRQADPRLGWVLVPARTGRSEIGGRTIEYAIDDAGYRVRSAGDAVHPERPTIVFAGESVMFGEGLTWDESIPAQAGAMLGIQSANVAVHGYGTDQIYLRLERELPRFRQPVAVVSIFMTELFGRNLDDDRPHLSPGLAWQPAARASRLASLAGMLVPFRLDGTVDAGVTMTRDVLRATAQLAHARGADLVIVVPQFGSEDDVQRALRARVMTDDASWLLVTLEADWRLPWDRHPNARAAHVIAEAIAMRLRGA